MEAARHLGPSSNRTAREERCPRLYRAVSATVGIKRDFQVKHRLGNTYGEPLPEIWNGGEYKTFRYMTHRGKVPIQCEDWPRYENSRHGQAIHGQGRRTRGGMQSGRGVLRPDQQQRFHECNIENPEKPLFLLSLRALNSF